MRCCQIVEGGDGSCTSRPAGCDARRCSLVDLTVSRHARRESLHHLQQHQSPSFDTSTSGQRPHVRLLGGRPPPLLRRSSFPVQMASSRVDLQLRSPAGTPAKLSRRPSVDSEGDSSPDMGRRRVRIIRRH
uniref:Uncharacterized protein n=1 Tax=Timema douglasi TaxID=61478 RepID=A0A7R8ZCV7_TIMDO|nr:unnamed protein product [Timema douglasi]